MADTPKIRFKGFTEAWEQRKLGTIISEKLSNGVINKSGTQFSNVKHINVINMYTPDKIHTDDLTPSSHDENAIYKCNVEVGDVFMTRSSLKPEGIAEANVLLDSGKYVFDDHLIRMKVDKSKYDPIFVKINLRNKMIKKQFVMKSKTTAFTTIGQEDILECDGMFPLFNEQTKIGKYFQKLDDLITLHQHKCDETKELKKYMLQKMFPQRGKKIPEIRFAGFTGDWEQRKVNELCSISTGKSNTQDKIDDGEYPFYVRSSIIERSSKFLYDEEAVLTVGDGVGTGKVFHYVNGKYDLHQRCYRMFDFLEELNAKYFYYIFSKMFYKRVMAMTAKTSVDSVRLEMIADMYIPVPVVDEQKRIGTYFSNLDYLITLHQRKCDELKEVKKFMLQNMFPQKG